jgi:hypothetical protein
MSERISPTQYRELKEHDPTFLLVCAYDSEEKFRANHLDGAISLDAFQKQLGNIEKERGIAFY